ncbi:NADP-dependent oxidoreductase [Streptomyces griseoviridis]
MRAVRFHHYGDIDVLRVEDVEQRALRPHDVLVRMRAAGINPGEAKIRTGALHERFPASFPSGQGSDLAGTVVETGCEVTRWRVGDEVLGWSWERSSHAELVVVPDGQLVAKPEGLAWETAGALYVSGSTACAAVAAVAPAPGETVVVTAATGGVGSIAVQLVRRAGAHVIAVASPRHGDWLRARGATVVPYGEGVEDRLRRAAGPAPSGFLDFHGGDYVRLAVALGVAPARINTIDYGAAAAYGTRSDASAEGSTPETLTRLAGLVAEGAVRVPVSAVHPLEEVRQAFRELEHAHPLGKIVLTS